MNENGGATTEQTPYPAYRLRDAANSDHDFIYQIKKQSIYPYVERLFGWDEEYQRNDFESDFNMHDFKIIEADERSVGFVQTTENEYRINLTELHLLPAYQGRGIGSDIIRGINARAVRNNKYVTTGCFIANERARRLYERLGFSLKEKTNTHYVFQYQARPRELPAEK